MRKIVFEDYVKVNNDIFMIDMNINMFYRMNILSGNIDIMGSIPEEAFFSKRLGAKIIYHRDCLYFSPMNAKKIWRWNIKTHEWKGYERKEILSWTKQGDMFQAVLYGDKIFFIGCLYPAIIVLDTISDSVEYIEKPYEHINAKATLEKDAYFRTDYAQVGDQLYLASCVSNEVLKLKLNSYEYEFITVGEQNNKYSGICYKDGLFYLSPRKKTHIVIWNGNDEVKEIELPMRLGDEDNAIFAGVTSDGDKVIFPGRFREKTIVMEAGANRKGFDVSNESYYFYKPLDGGGVIALKSSNNLIIKQGDKEYNYSTEISNEKISKYIKENEINPFFDNDGNSQLLYENNYTNMEMMLSLLV